MKTASAAAACVALTLAACATQPEPCTAEWVEWKTDRIYSDFARDHDAQLDAIRDLGESLAGDSGSSLGIIGMATLIPGVVTMVGAFMNRAVPEVREAIAQCGNSPGAARLFADFMRREGVSEKAATAIENLGLLLEADS